MPVIKDTYDPLFYYSAVKWQVPFTWLKAIAGAESDYNPRAYRAEPQINDASRGLMQVLMKTAVALGYTGTPEGLYDPETNVDLGAKLIRENITRFGQSFERVYSAYNSGKPDLYLTSSQVRRNVARAVEYLRAVENAITTETPSVPEQPGGTEDEPTSSEPG